MAFDRLLQNLDIDIQAIALCEVRQGVRLLASPEQSTVVHYVLDGSMHLSVGDYQTLVCGAGAVVVVPPGLSQAVSADATGGAPVSAANRLALTADGLVLVDAADGQAGDLRFACGAISTQLHPLIDLLGAEPFSDDLSDLPFVREAFATILLETSRRACGARAMASALMKACLLLLIRRRLERSAEPGDSAFYHPKISCALAEVLDRPASPHTVATLAAKAGMSRSGFAREFLETLGITPMVFVGRVRLAAAANLLKSTSMPIKTLAMAVGFASRSHFSRCFKEAYGVDPTEYRRGPGGPPAVADGPGRVA